MKSGNIIKKLGLLSILSLLTVVSTFNCLSQDEVVQEVSKREMKKAYKHNQKIPRLTYFIHSGDSIIQLFNVTATKADEGIEIGGNITELDQGKIDLYEMMLNDADVRKIDKEVKVNDGNQAHIHTSDFSSKSGRVTLNLNSAENYVLYNGGTKVKRRHPWIMPVMVVGGTVGALAGLLFLLDALVDSILG